jgi:hypothetical protein
VECLLDRRASDISKELTRSVDLLDRVGEFAWRALNTGFRRSGPAKARRMGPLGTRDPVFYRRWIFANGWAEAAGLGTTFIIGQLAAPWLPRSTGLLSILLGALVAVLLGTLLEGVVVGVAQEAVLRQRLLSLRKRMWVVATAAGAGLAWFLGMIPSTVMALHSSAPASSPPAEPPALLQYALASALGLLTGPVLGLAQWVVLQAHTPRSGRWLWANALAWAIGMPLIFLGMDYVPWTGPRSAVYLMIYAVCGAVGLVVGAIHGRILVGLMPPRGD